MKTLDTLVKDIFALFEGDYVIPEADIRAFGHVLAQHIADRAQERSMDRHLRMSMLGWPMRKLWYAINRPDKAEKINGETRLKFLYGDIIESLVLFLAQAAGHTIEGAQDDLTFNGVHGHRDAIIDGVLVDVKSASSFGFKKFQEHALEDQDPFGYLDQINAYLFASQDDPVLKEKRHAAFLAVDKTVGKICIDKYTSNGVDYHKRVDEIRAVLASPGVPERCYPDEDFGKSGNRALGVACSYCPFKFHCWDGLRAYYYSTGPKYLTHVAREPRVQEQEASSPEYGF